MSYDIPGFVRSYEVVGDLSAQFLRFVKFGSNVGTLLAVANNTDAVIGVLQNKPAAAGNVAAVMVSGVSRVVAAEALAAGVAVYIDADGKVTATDVHGNCVGVTETACSAEDDLVSVLLKPLGAVGVIA